MHAPLRWGNRCGCVCLMRLFQQHPDLQAFFADTDMRVQKSKLTMALQVVAYSYLHPNAAMSDFIGHLGWLHRLRHISPRDLCKFRDVLLTSLEGFHGTTWTEELGLEWTRALDKSIELMNTEPT